MGAGAQRPANDSLGTLRERTAPSPATWPLPLPHPLSSSELLASPPIAQLLTNSGVASHHFHPHWALNAHGPVLRPLACPPSLLRSISFVSLTLVSSHCAVSSLPCHLQSFVPIPLLKAAVYTQSELPVSPSSPSLLPPHRLSPLLRSIPVWPRDDGGPGHL